MDRLRLFVWQCVLIAISLAIALAGGATASAQSSAPTSGGWVVLPVTEYTALKRAASRLIPNLRHRPSKQR